MSDLTLAECAALATIPKAPTDYSLYFTLYPEDVGKDDKVLAETEISGSKYVIVYNPAFEDRKNYVLSKMAELGYINENEKNDALKEDISASINPPERKLKDVSSYYTAYVKRDVVKSLMNSYSLSEDEAYEKLYHGGLKIYSNLDVDLQKKLESVYSNFNQAILGEGGEGSLNYLTVRTNDNGDIVDNADGVIFYKKPNILTEDNSIYLSNGEFEVLDNGLKITSPKAYYQEGSLMFRPFYTINENGDLYSHDWTVIPLESKFIQKSDDGSITINKEFLDSNKDFYSVDEVLTFNKSFYKVDTNGLVQPQSSTVVMDQTNGNVLAMLGGRGKSLGTSLNRAVDSARQPGSSIKPIAVYAPALEKGDTLATVIDDLPHYNDKGELWPQNWYGTYKGLISLRESIEISANVNAVKKLEDIGIDYSKTFLSKFGLIDKGHPANDTFISRAENNSINDENTAAMALGGMTYGFTNLKMTTAYSVLANGGKYNSPKSFSKVLDSRGNIVLENSQENKEVLKPGNAFLITDALHSTTNHGVAANAQVEGFDVAGKTGTSGTVTSNQDSWFMGYSPYYTVGVWIGADNQNLKLSEVSVYSTKLWGAINKALLEGHTSKKFQKPSDIVEVEVCVKSGDLPSDACRIKGEIKKEYFVKGTEPKTESKAYVWKKVDLKDGLLAPDDAPDEFVETRAFLTRDPIYDPSKNNGIVPEDWDQMVPSQKTTTDYEELAKKKEEEEKKKKEEEEKKKKKRKIRREEKMEKIHQKILMIKKTMEIS